MYDFLMVIKQNGKLPKSPPELRVGVTDSIKVGGVRACVCIMLFVHCPRLLPPDIFGSKAPMEKGGWYCRRCSEPARAVLE